MSLEIMTVDDDDLHRQFLFDTVMQGDRGDIAFTQTCDGEEAFEPLTQKTLTSAVVDLQMSGKARHG